MADTPTIPVRGGLYPYTGIRRRGHFLVVSLDALNQAGTAVVVEVTTDTPPEDLRSLLAVELGPDDPLPGAWVLAWRLNYISADRLDTIGGLGTLTENTLTRVIAAIHAVIEP